MNTQTKDTDIQNLDFSSEDLNDPLELSPIHLMDRVAQAVLWLSQNMDPSKVSVRQSGDEDHNCIRVLYDKHVVLYGNSVVADNGLIKCRCQVSKLLHSYNRHFLFENRTGR